MHAIQALLLVTALLGLLATRHRWLRNERVRARLVGVAALGYTGVFAVLTWQAKRGQSVIRPDWQTLIAFAAVVVFTLAATAAVIITARRRPAPPTEETQHDDLPGPTAAERPTATMRGVG